MKPNPIQWTESKQRNLFEQLQGYWAEDEWRIGDCPIQDGCTDYSPNRPIRFSCRIPTLQAEIKLACWHKLLHREWKTKTLWSLAYYIQDLCEWLDTQPLQITSLLHRDLSDLQTAFRSYLVRQNKLIEHFQHQLGSDQTMREYPHGSWHLHVLTRLYKKLEAVYDDRNEYDKEIWDVRVLGYRGNPSRSSYTLNFANITQPWLLQAAKAWVKCSLPLFSLGECQARAGTLRNFSTFLRTTYPSLKPSELSRTVIVDYLAHLAGSGLHEQTRLAHLTRLRTFLEVCSRERWAAVPDRRLIYREDCPRIPKRKPRFIPEDVLTELNANVDGLSEPIQRMVLILQEVGMRLGELCRMQFDCLSQDTQGDWFLCYYQYKMKRDHSVPISRELVAVIQEQQAVVKAQYGQHRYLFPSPYNGHRGEATKQGNFSKALNKLAVERNICDQTGAVYRFQAHQFRHTVGTRMVNLGVPQHIIQRYLGHSSPEMTSTYAHIHDQTLKAEFAKFQRKIVDVTGKVIIPKGISVDSAEFQWFKRNVLAQALPNGSCALPLAAGECPHANACLTCTHFRTDARFLGEHKKQLEQTEQLLETARANGWARQIEMNEKVRTNLERIVDALKEETDETST